MTSVCILDYGSGNVRSVFNLFSGIAEHVVVSNDPVEFRKATHIVLPGVGAFKTSMLKIRERLPMAVLEEVVLGDRKPFLGICVGMQVLADFGVEFGEFPGLGWIGGRVEKINAEQLSLPHIGWNGISYKQDSHLFAGLGHEPDFYFVHSYAFRPKGEAHVLATTTYGEEFCSVIQHDNILGVQFHPEKSQRTGIRLAKNFLSVPWKKNRLIPVLLLRNGWLVQSKQFRRYQNLGNPTSAVKRLSEWASDELIYLDISSDDSHDMRRDDLGHPNRQSTFEIIEDVSRVANMPITVGGRVRTLQDIERRLSVGADKIAINSVAIDDPAFVEKAAREFGSQCIVVSIDVKKQGESLVVFGHGGKQATTHAPDIWARTVEMLGAGEILINSIDRDGMKTGYDLELLVEVADAVRIPVIACGGVGDWAHFAEAFEKTGIDAVAAANIFHYSDQSVFLAKRYLFEHGFNVRPPELFDF